MKKPHIERRNSRSPDGDSILLCKENAARERGSHLSPGAVGTRAWNHTYTQTYKHPHTHTYIYIHIHTRDEDEAREAEWQPRCHAGCEGGWTVPAPVVAIQPTHPTTTAHPPPPDTLFLPRWQAGALHFRVLQPAGVPKEMKTMRYSGHPLPMLVASLNSHLYYLSASKSARASPEPLDSVPSHRPPLSPHSAHLSHSSLLSPDVATPWARARATGCM